MPSKLHTRDFITALFLVEIICSSLPAFPPDSLISRATENTVTHEFLPIANDGQRCAVDADSIITIELKRSLDWQKLANDPIAKSEVENDWSMLTTILQGVKSIEQERLQFEAGLLAINMKDSDAVRSTRDRVRAFNQRVAKTLDVWQQKLGLPDDAFQQIQLGNTNPSLPYQNIAKYLQIEIARLKAKTNAITSGAHLKVNVSAYTLTTNGAQQRIHVDPYDNIPAGNPDSQRSSLFTLSATDATRLKTALVQTQATVDVLREIEALAKQTKGQRQSVLEELREQINLLVKHVRRSLENLGDLASVQTALPLIVNDSHSGSVQKEAATRIVTVLVGLRTQISALKTATESVDTEATELHDLFKGTNLFSIVDIPLKVSKILDKVKSEVNTLKDGLQALGNTSDLLISDLEIVATAQSKELLEDLQQVAKENGETSSLLSAIEKAANLFTNVIPTTGVEAVTNLPIDCKWPDLASAPAANIHLKRSGVPPGSELDIKIGYQRDDGTAPPPVETISIDITEFGFYRKIDANLIFAMATSGDEEARKWKSNLAATAHWFYRFRSRAGARAAWNAINPGIGLHAASLSQGNDSVEFGFGINASLFDGMITGGYGYNLSTKNRYCFVGISLIEVLNRARNVEKQDSNK